MLYVQVPTEEAAKLSAAMFALSRPTAIRNPRDVTTHYCPWHVNKDDPTLAVLAIPEDAPLKIHKLANTKAVKDIFTKLKAGTDIDAVIGAVDASKEQAIAVSDILPEKLKTEALTKEQATEAGYLEGK